MTKPEPSMAERMVDAICEIGCKPPCPDDWSTGKARAAFDRFTDGRRRLVEYVGALSDYAGNEIMDGPWIELRERVAATRAACERWLEGK